MATMKKCMSCGGSSMKMKNGGIKKKSLKKAQYGLSTDPVKKDPNTNKQKPTMSVPKKYAKGGSSEIVGMPQYTNNPRSYSGASLKHGGRVKKSLKRYQDEGEVKPAGAPRAGRMTPPTAMDRKAAADAANQIPRMTPSAPGNVARVRAQSVIDKNDGTARRSQGMYGNTTPGPRNSDPYGPFGTSGPATQSSQELRDSFNVVEPRVIEQKPRNTGFKRGGTVGKKLKRADEGIIVKPKYIKPKTGKPKMSNDNPGPASKVGKAGKTLIAKFGVSVKVQRSPRAGKVTGVNRGYAAVGKREPGRIIKKK